MKNTLALPLLIAVFLSISCIRILAQSTDSPSLNVPIITGVTGSSPQTIQVKFIDTNVADVGYQFYYGTSPESLTEFDNIYYGPQLDSGKVVVYNTNSGYEPNTTVYIKIAAFSYDSATNETPVGPYTEVVSATTLASWPPSPSNFTGVAEGKVIRLTWEDNSPPGHPFDEAAWGIMRAVDCCNFTKAYTVPANTTTFVDNDVTPNTTYQYTLESINDFGLSNDVYSVSVTSLPVSESPSKPGSHIDFTAVSAISMSISFKPGDGSHHLAVMKAESPPAFVPRDNHSYSGDVGDGEWVVNNGQDSSFNVTGLLPETTYFIKIFEYNADGINILYLSDSPALGSSRTVYEATALQLYGLAFNGGSFNHGTIFKVDTTGEGLRPIHNFAGVDGANPYGSLIQTADGSLLGMTSQGGSSQFPHGVIFRMNSDGTGYEVLREFMTASGDNPFGSLMQTSDGSLVGTTIGGGDFERGTVFKVKTDGSNYTVIHSFSGTDGSGPRCTLLQSVDGKLYGMTPWGGASDFGTIFRLNSNGTGFETLHNFSEEIPQGSLIQAPNGVLYGMTSEGGSHDVGTIFKIDPDGSNFATLFNFDNLNGRFPTGSLTLGEDNTLYGMTDAGGPFFENGAVQGGGTIFKINTDGTHHTILHSFVPATGASPTGASLVLYGNKLYGYTTAGGASDGGVVFHYNLSTNTYKKLSDLTDTSGKNPSFGSLLLLRVVMPPIGVENFSVVDVRSGNKLSDFEDSVSLDVGDPDLNYWTIRANTYPAPVGSVLFRIDVQKKNVENRAPYLLAAHYLCGLSPTPHIFETEVYSERLATGSRLQSRAALITFTNKTSVSSLIVLNEEGEVVQELNEGDVINAGDPVMRNFNIEALLNRDADWGSVQFYINGEYFWTENRAPYIMVTGHRKWWSAPGLYTVTATPYSARDAGGLPGVPRTITFTISEMPADASQLRISDDSLTANGRKQRMVSAYPVPAHDVLYLRADDGFPEQDLMVVILDVQGETRLKKLVTLGSQPYMLHLTDTGLSKGMYQLQLQSRGMTQTIRFIKE